MPLPPDFINELSKSFTGEIRTDALLDNQSARDSFIYGIKGEDAENPASAVETLRAFVRDMMPAIDDALDAVQGGRG